MSEAAIIQIENLRKVYKVGKVDVEALRGVSLEDIYLKYFHHEEA